MTDCLIHRQTDKLYKLFVKHTHTLTLHTFSFRRRKGRHYNPYNIRKGQRIKTNAGITDIRRAILINYLPLKTNNVKEAGLSTNSNIQI